MIEIRCACGCRYRIDESRISDTARCPNLDCGIVVRIERRDSIPVAPPLPRNVTMQDWLRESTNESSRRPDRRRRNRDIKIGLSILAGLAVLLGLLWLISWASEQPEDAPASPPTSETTRPPTKEEMRKSPNSEGYIKPLPPPKFPRIQSPKTVKVPHFAKLSTISPVKGPVRAPEIAEPVLLVPACAIGRSPERPETGDAIEPDNGTSWESTLEITNGLNVDAAVRLVNSSTNITSRLVYIRAKTAYKIQSIERGEYYLRYVTGEDWIPNCADFQRNEDVNEFEKTFSLQQNMVEEADGYKKTWTEASASLNPVWNGTARTRKIDKKRFWQGDQHFSVQQTSNPRP
jgi:hypothetical protein